jgi:hypothetical protein
LKNTYNNKFKRILQLVLLIAFIFSIFILVYFFGPAELVNMIGVKNSYLLAFLVSFFGGFSSGGSITFISLLITLVAGGINPINLGILAGIGLAIGDIIMFYTGSKGRDLVNEKWDQKLNMFAEVFEKNKWLKKATPVIAYIYIGILPLPNDIMILFLAMIKYPTSKMNIIIILSDLTFALLITILTSRGIILNLF